MIWWYMTCSMILEETRVQDMGRWFSGESLLPDLKTGTTFPTFQSGGRMLDNNDCENNKVKYTAHTCLMFIKKFWVKIVHACRQWKINIFYDQNDPTRRKKIGGIGSVILESKESPENALSLVKTEKKASLEILAHSMLLGASSSPLEHLLCASPEGSSPAKICEGCVQAFQVTPHEKSAWRFV